MSTEVPWALLGLPDDFALAQFTLALAIRDPDPLEPLEVVSGDLFDVRQRAVAGGLACPTIFGELNETNRFGYVKLHAAFVHPLALVCAPGWLAARAGVTIEDLRLLADWRRWAVCEAASDSGVEVGALYDEAGVETLRYDPVELATGALAIDRLLALRGYPAISVTQIRVLPIGLRTRAGSGEAGKPLSDLDALYRPVQNRGIRVRRLLELRAPEIIVRNEMRLTQVALEQLFCNEWRGHTALGDDGQSTREQPLVFGERVVESLLGSVASTLAQTLVELDGATEPLPKRLIQSTRVIQALSLELRSR